TEDLVEPRELVRCRYDVRGWHDGSQEPLVVADRHELIEGQSKRTCEQLRQRRRGGGPGDVVERNLCQILSGDAVAVPAEAKWVEDALREHSADVLAGRAIHDLAKDVTARDRVIREKPAWLRKRLGVATDEHHEVAF